MQLHNILGALALSGVAHATYSLDLVYQFANSFSGVGYVNIENVAVRSTNDQLLLNTVTGAIMVQLDPDNPVPELLVNISNVYPGAPGSLTGIAQTGYDVYTVAAGNFIFGPQVPGGLAGVAGSWSIWNVDLSCKPAAAKKLVDIPEAIALNGITKQPGEGNKDYILVADSGVGAIWRVNVKTGAYSQYLSSPVFAPQPYFQLGINGLKATSQYVYFTNSAIGVFGGVPIDASGNPAGPAIPFVSAPNGSSFDDFALDFQYNAYVAGPPTSVFKLLKEAADPIVLVNDTQLLGPTSCVFRGKDLFVVTGGQGGPMPQSGQVFKISGATGEKMRRWTA